MQCAGDVVVGLHAGAGAKIICLQLSLLRSSLYLFERYFNKIPDIASIICRVNLCGS